MIITEKRKRSTGRPAYPVDKRILPVMCRPGQGARLLLPDGSGLDIFVDEIREQDGHFWAGIIISSDRHNIARQFDGPQINIDCLGAVMEPVEPPAPPAAETVVEAPVGMEV